MIAGKAPLWGFIKSSNYSHHARPARPQQFAMVEGFLNIQALLWLKVKPGQGYLLGYICTRTISEVWCGMCALEETAGRPQEVNSCVAEALRGDPDHASASDYGQQG